MKDLNEEGLEEEELEAETEGQPLCPHCLGDLDLVGGLCRRCGASNLPFVMPGASLLVNPTYVLPELSSNTSVAQVTVMIVQLAGFSLGIGIMALVLLFKAGREHDPVGLLFGIILWLGYLVSCVLLMKAVRKRRMIKSAKRISDRVSDMLPDA